MSEVTTGSDAWVSRSPSVGRVAFLFGLTGQEQLSGAVLRRLLADLGVAPAAARATLARMARAGQLTSRREGRTTSYALSGAFAAGFERVRRQEMAQPIPWTGHFHALLYSVPEPKRAFRDQFRRAAIFAGYGLLQPGLLIALTDRSGAVAGVVAAAPPAAQIRTATLGMTSRAGGERRGHRMGPHPAGPDLPGTPGATDRGDPSRGRHLVAAGVRGGLSARADRHPPRASARPGAASAGLARDPAARSVRRLPVRPHALRRALPARPVRPVDGEVCDGEERQARR